MKENKNNEVVKYILENYDMQNLNLLSQETEIEVFTLIKLSKNMKASREVYEQTRK